jgi:hypothetical protein
MTTERGIALILAILATSFLTAMGLGLALVVFMDRLASGNARGSVAMLYAADAALELAVRDLAHLDNWDPALRGDVRGSFTDGEPGRAHVIAGSDTIDLIAATNQLRTLDRLQRRADRGDHARTSVGAEQRPMAAVRIRTAGKNRAVVAPDRVLRCGLGRRRRARRGWRSRSGRRAGQSRPRRAPGSRGRIRANGSPTGYRG